MDEWFSGASRVLVLGEFEMAKDGHRLPARTRQTARLGALLATQPGMPMHRDQIIEVLWGENPPTTANNTLQVHVSQLRAMVGRDLVRTAGNGYALNVDPSSVDAEWFFARVLTCIDHASDGQSRQARNELAQLLTLWRGDPYQGLNDPSIEARRSQLVELRECAIETRLELSLSLADSARGRSEVVAEAKGQIARQPLRERGYEILIKALVAEGRFPEAVRTYRDAETTFSDLAGAQPSPRLKTALGESTLTIT